MVTYNQQYQRRFLSIAQPYVQAEAVFILGLLEGSFLSLKSQTCPQKLRVTVILSL